MANVFDWPPDLAPRAISFNGRGRTIAGPMSLTGRSQVGQADAGYWVATLTELAVVPPASTVRLFRAFLALLEGGANHARVPVFDDENTPWPLDEDGVPITSLGEFPRDDGSYFDDDTGRAQPAIVVDVAAAAALRATSISVTVRQAGEIGGGEYFSIGDRLYTIKRVLSVSGTAQTWAIWPPLRAAAAVGTELNFDRPVCRMRLASESEGDLALEMGLYGFPDASFVEVFE